MPLPDAPDYSQRIYELLKETDLENLSYAQFQSVAEKIFIEPENEDEMRRLVLVQLARMAVRGDWDGFLSGSTATIGGSIATDQVAFGSGTNEIEGNNNFKFTGSSVLELANTLDIGGIGAAGIIKNSNSNQDLELKVTGTGNVRVKNDTTNTDSQLSVQGNGTGTPKVALSNDTKAVTLQCDNNQKLTVKGGTEEFVFDASSATGGITFPDGTTQNTASSGGGAFAVLPDLVNVTYSVTTSQYQDIHGVYNSGYGDVNISCNEYQSFFFYRPFYAMTSATLSKIHLRMNGGTSGNTADFAIYDSDSDGKPNTKIGSITSANISTAGSLSFSIVEESTGSMSLTKGNLYWVGIKCSTTGSWATIRGRNGYETSLLGYSDLGATQLEAYTVIVGNATAGATFSGVTTSQKQAVMLGGEYA